MEPAPAKRWGLRFSLRKLFGVTTFSAAVLAVLRASELYRNEKGLIIAWALLTVIGIALARSSVRSLVLSGLLGGLTGSCIPAAIWYVKYEHSRVSLIEDYGYPILALSIVGATAGGALGLAAWLCSRPRRIATAAVVCLAVGLPVVAWRSLAYWQPRQSLTFKPGPLTIGLSADGQLLGSDGDTVFLWEAASQRRLHVQFDPTEVAHAVNYTRMRFLACDERNLIVGRWGQGVLKVFALDDGQEVAALPVPAIGVRFCRFVGENTLVIGWSEAGRDKIGVWDARNWDLQELLYDGIRATNIAISSDLRTIAVSDADGIQITRRGESGSQHLPFVSRLEGVPLLLSPDGRWLANFNRLWDLTTEKVTDFEVFVGFSPDSNLVVSFSRRLAASWLSRLPDSVQSAPLLHRLRGYRPQFQLTATEASSGRIVAESVWIDGDVLLVALAEGPGIFATSVGNGGVLLWRIPGRR